jgi:hypothetical protein
VRERRAAAVLGAWGAAGVLLGLAGGAFLLVRNTGAALTWEGPFVLVGTCVLLGASAFLSAGLLATQLARLFPPSTRRPDVAIAVAGLLAGGMIGFSTAREMDLSRALRMAMALAAGIAGAALALGLARSAAGGRLARIALGLGAVSLLGLGGALASLVSEEGVYGEAADPRDFVPRFEPLAQVPERTPVSERVIVLGLDGATWDRIEPGIERGRLPNFARLRREGASGPLASLKPTLSAPLWTTVATGKPREVHGIRRHYLLQGRFSGTGNLDFPTWLDLVEDALLGARLLRNIPVTSSLRRCKAIWNIVSEAGGRVGVLGWWASWPAEPVEGFVVSDLASSARIRELVDRGDRFQNVSLEAETITYPADLLRQIEPLERSPASVTREELARFVAVEDGVWEEFRREEPFDWKRPLTVFRATYLKDIFFADVAQELDERGRPDLLLAYLKGIDVFGHIFWKFSDPRALEEGRDPREVERYRDVVDRAYEWTDGLLGRFLERLRPGETLVVLSDHGWETEGPGEYGHERAPAGILAMIGGPVRVGARIEGAGLYDVAPTLLHLLGLPKGEDMPGRVLVDVLDAPSPVRTIPTWETRRIGRYGAIASSEAEAQERALRALGYLK